MKRRGEYISNEEQWDYLRMMVFHDKEILNDESTIVLRVCGGWIYKFYNHILDKETPELVSCVFVPYDRDGYVKRNLG